MTVCEKKKMLLEKERYDVDDLVTVIEVLRSEEGCPWDREQDHKSIRKDLIEETYEVVEAIDTDDPVLLREELGDLLLQVVFHTQIEAEKQVFVLGDVANDICVKLIHRHPHVFGDVEADTSEKVLANWEIIKSEEKSRNTVTDKLRAIPPMLPSLMRAAKVSKKAGLAADVSLEDLRQSLLKELSDQEWEGQSAAQNEAAIGAILLSLTGICEKLGVDAEAALQHATDREIQKVDSIV
jgi:tetrapyrrole methylase family protein/MazG family protein